MVSRINILMNDNVNNDKYKDTKELGDIQIICVIGIYEPLQFLE
jgi:hypothetical protein